MGFKSGIVAIVGKPNVGKSTLLNRLVGQKVSIVSNKPQTTRRRVLGIAQGDGFQIAFIDTPGIHEPHTKLGRAMVESAKAALAGVDLVLFVADASGRPGELDKQIAALAVQDGRPVFAPIVACLNKMDLLKADQVVATVEAYTSLLATEDVMLTTATAGHNVLELQRMLLERLPEGRTMFPEDDYTDQSVRFMTAEIIREKILNATRQEIPHSTAVSIESWEEQPQGRVVIGASVVVEKPSQRAILIGHRGQFVKKVGTEARQEIEALLGADVYLELHVRVREGWRQNPRMLQELEYTD